MIIITPDPDTQAAAVLYAIDSSGKHSSSWRTLDRRMNEDDARFAFESVGKPSDMIDVPGPWRHKLVRLVVNRTGYELERIVLDERIEA